MGCISSGGTTVVHHHHHHGSNSHSRSHSHSGGHGHGDHGGGGGGGGVGVGTAVAAGVGGAVVGAAGGAAAMHLADEHANGGVQQAVDDYGEGEDMPPEDAPPEDGAEDGAEEPPPEEDAPPEDAPPEDAPPEEAPPEDGGDGGEEPPPEDMGEAVDMYGEAEPDDSDFNKRKDWDKGEMVAVGLNNLSTRYAAKKRQNNRKRKTRSRWSTRTQKIGEDSDSGSGSEMDEQSIYEQFLNKDKVFEKRPFWRKSEKDRTKSDLITVVTQCSLDRLKQLDNMCLTWEGIISVAVYVPSNLNDADLSELEELFIKTEDTQGAYKAILDIHLLCCAVENADGEENDKIWYPINKLRNLALNNALSKYVFLLDIDFIPSSNLQENIVNTLTNREYNNDFGNDNKFALVIPAFEYNKYVSSVNNINGYPVSNKKELIKEYKNKSATPFHMAKFKPGHYSTNYSKWVDDDQERPNGDYYKTEYQLYYEPYIIVKNDSNLRRYDERFNGYGFNKIVHIAGLAIADGYNFYVLNDGFVLSPLHRKSKDFIKTYRNKNMLKRKQRKKHIGKLATVAFNEMYEEANRRVQVVVS